MADTSAKSSPTLRASGFFGLALVTLLLGALSGCVILDKYTVSQPSEPPPVPVNHVLTYWEPSVRFVADAVNPGAQLPGLAGRVYLLNDDLKEAVDAQGTISAMLYDMTAAASGGEPKHLASWNFKEADLKRLKRKDRIGDGYTLFLPWESYGPQIKHVKLLIAYNPKNSPPHYAEPTLFTLRTEGPLVIDQTQKLLTGTATAAKK